MNPATLSYPAPMETTTAKFPSASYDNKIYTKFSATTLDKKGVNKEEFQKEFGLLPEKKTLLLGFCLPLTEKNGAALLSEVLPGIEALGVQIAFLAIGTEKYQRIMTDFAAENESSVVMLENTEANMRKFYAACDSMLFLTSSTDANQALRDALAYGIVPLAQENAFPDLLHDYNPNQEKGNSFLFSSYDPWHVFAALVRATENYRFPYDWKNIAKEGMETVS